MTTKEILQLLKQNANPAIVEGMTRYGISTENALGVNVPFLRDLAKKIGKNHKIALELWQSKIHEARILASYIDDYHLVTKTQMDNWANDFDSWDVCDQVCGNLFDKTPFASEVAVDWTSKEKEFVKRAGFVLFAGIAVHNKKASDELFMSFLPYIEKEAIDNRNYVKKAVNWALRQIGKRNSVLRDAAIESAERIFLQGTKSAKWIAQDALRELKKK